MVAYLGNEVPQANITHSEIGRFLPVPAAGLDNIADANFCTKEKGPALADRLRGVIIAQGKMKYGIKHRP